MVNMVSKLWDICDVAKGLRCYAPEMATLFFLKFTSQNADLLGITISKLNSFDALVELYANDTITQAEFLRHSSDIVIKAEMEQFKIAEHFSQFISTSADVKMIKRLLLMIRDLDFSDSPKKCMVADAFTAYLSNDTGWDGLSKSAISNAELMACLAVHGSTKTIYDGACGYGISLAAATRKAPAAMVYGQDVIQNCTMISAIMQWLNFRKDFCLTAGNSVKNPLPGREGVPNKFDSVIIDPPFGFRFEDEDIAVFPEELLSYKDLTQRRGDWFFVQHALAVLNDRGIAVVQASMGTLFATGKAFEIRKTVIEQGHVKAIIELPAGMVPGSQIPVSLMVLGNANDYSEVVLVNAAAANAEHFFNRQGKTKCAMTPEGIREIANIVNDGLSVEGISKVVSISELAEKNYILTPSAYLSIPENAYTYSSIEEITSEMARLESELAVTNSALSKALSAICE